MLIGIPTETQLNEKRVCITPAGVYNLAQEGHRVFVEHSAGVASGFTPQAYADAGGEIVFQREEIFQRAEMICKVQPPSADEAALCRPNATIFSFLTLAIFDARVCQILIDHGTSAVGLDLMMREDGQLPILTAISEIAGVMAPHVAARYLQTIEGGRGILLGGIAGLPPATVLILGAGVVGTNAAISFLGAGAGVMVLDSNLDRLRHLELATQHRATTAVASPYNIARYTPFADVLVGAVFIPSQRTPHLVFEEHVKAMKRGSLIMDISIDQGGCVETSRPTNHHDPVFEKYGVTHYCVPNMTAAVARTASHALNNVTTPYLLRAASNDREEIWRKTAEFRTGTYLFEGKCTNASIAGLFNLQSHPLDELLGA